MKYFYQFSVILAVSLVGEALHALIPLPIPASIYGLVLMLILLCTGMLKLDQVRETGLFLTENMTIMFVPPAVGLLTVWDEVRSMLLPMIVICLLSTVIVFGVTGKTADLMMRKGGRS